MTADAVGGVWTYAMELGGALAARGRRVSLVVCGPGLAKAQREEAEEAGLALVPDTLPLDWLCDGPDAVLAGGERLAELATDHDALLLNSPALAARARFGVPVVAVAHGDVGTWWAAARPGVALDPAYEWLTGLIGEGLRAADQVVAPTAAHGAAVRAFHGLERPVAAVWNGRSPVAPQASSPPATSFPPSPFFPPPPSSPRTRGSSIGNGEAEPCGWSGLDPRVRGDDDLGGTYEGVHALTVGRLWDDAKDLATLDAAAALTATPIHAIGTLSGPNGEHAHLPNLHTPGPHPQAKLAALLDRRPTFVSTATYEPFGLAVLEAAQAGCPLVLSDIPSFRELWDGAATFVPPRDAAGFARAIEAPTASGEAARERAARYTVDAMANNMETLIAEALHQRAAQEQVA